ncbi:VF530 family DNA-binding protein [Reinekea forsetii]|nr:VF530 family DNA-binding protein [Reinekea forsetii]
MSEQYLNNPLHGLKLDVLLTELVDFYGWEILAAALNFNCFKTNPSIKGSVKFFRKTEWARHKLEAFYLYRYKHLPRPDDKQFALPPRDRIIPEHQKPRDPVVLTLEELERINERKAKNAPKPNRGRPNNRTESNYRSQASSTKPSQDSADPWANARKIIAEKNSDNS